MNSDLLLSYLSFLGCVQGTFLCLLILTKRKTNKDSKFILATLLAVLTLQFSRQLLSTFVEWSTITMTYASLFLIGPLLYLYIRSFSKRLTWSDYFVHFSWFVVYLLIIAFYSYKLGPFVASNPNELPLRPVAFFILVSKFLQMLLYYALCLKALRQHEVAIKENFTALGNIDLNWMRVAVNCYIGMVLILALLNTVSYIWELNKNTIGVLNAVMLLLYIYWLTAKGFKQQDIWSEEDPTIYPRLDKQSPDIGHSGVPVDRKNSLPVLSTISDQVISQIESNKLYLEPELTLTQLAKAVQSTPHLVSEAINTILLKSFYDLVNSYRIEEAKRLLNDQKNDSLKISYIGLSAGFNSKTTFNTLFKQKTGTTPSRFRENNRMH